MKKCRVAFLGTTMCGKTSLINLFFNQPNPLRTEGTIGVDLKKLQIIDCEFLIFDTNGHQQHQQIQMCTNVLIKSLKDPSRVIICYDMHSPNGGQDIQQYIGQVKSNNENAKIVILGTKQNLGEHENLKNIDQQFPEYRFYKAGLNGKEILTQIFHQFYEEIIAQQTLIQQELQIDYEKKFIQNKQEQNVIKKQKKKSFWGLCSNDYDD